MRLNPLQEPVCMKLPVTCEGKQFGMLCQFGETKKYLSNNFANICFFSLSCFGPCLQRIIIMHTRRRHLIVSKALHLQHFLHIFHVVVSLQIILCHKYKFWECAKNKSNKLNKTHLHILLLDILMLRISLNDIFLFKF